MSYIPPTSEPIAIIGSACRFPGDSTSPSKLWELLKNPRDLSQEIPSDRFNAQGFYHPDGEHHGTTNAPKAYFLDQDHRHFDATFFNITPKEAEAIDPQGKILLETVYEGMESTGITLQESMGKKIAVFVGTMTADFDLLTGKDELMFSQYCATGTSRAIISNRVSYFFHWNGPSMTIDTACSSSLVALHQAVLSLRSGESSMACVAGTNIIIGPEMFICESNLHMLSPNGRSRMWDQGADGYARGEGIACLFVKTLSKALADGDHIECIIRETGVNSDGRTKGITMPSATAQAALIRDTYSRSGLDSRNYHHRCQYFEAHGTGTQAGDPVEAEAIHTAFFGATDENSQNENPLLVGSIKTVIGHTEGAAGVAGVIKAMLAMKNQIIPPNQHLVTLNPKTLPFATNLKVPTRPLPWPSVASGHPLRASVNSFGFGGTNGHVILEHYDHAIHGTGHMPLNIKIPTPIKYSPIPFLLSANSEKTLLSMVQNFVDYLSTEREVDLAALAWTMAVRRSALPHRASFSAMGDIDVLIKEMQSRLAAAESSETEIGLRAKPTEGGNRVLGVFTGQGAQWPEMGMRLLQSSPVFQRTIQDLGDALRTCHNPPAWSLESELLAAPPQSRIDEAVISQPLCTAVQIALVDLLRAAGITFAAVVGHSSGEIAAAYATGKLTAREAILIAYYRGFHAKKAGCVNSEKGGMMAVGMGVEEAIDFCDQPAFQGRLSIAASNAPASITMSGDWDAVQEAKSLLDENGRFARVLKVDTAYHSHHMDRCAIPYYDSLSACDIQGAMESDTGSSVWISSVYGPAGKPTRHELKARYWRSNLVQPVLFAEALRRALLDEGPFDLVLEVGPHPALKGPALQTMQEAIGKTLPYTGVLKRGHDDVFAFSDALGTAWTVLGSSLPVDWESFAAALGVHLPSIQRVIKNLPSYPWEHKQLFYRQPRVQKQYVKRQAGPHELLGVRTSDDTDSARRWRNILKPGSLPWLRDHRFQGQIIVPAAAYCVMAFDAALAIAAASGSPRLVEIQDLRIQAGISMEDDTQGVETLFTLIRTVSSDASSWSASFTLDWAPVNNTLPMKTAVTGTVQVNFGESSAEVLPKRVLKHSDLHSTSIDEFYSSMHDIGLSYTGPFRALVSLKRRLDTAHGTLLKPHGDDLSALLVRPALLDASFQTAFAAFAAPGDGYAMYHDFTFEKWN